MTTCRHYTEVVPKYTSIVVVFTVIGYEHVFTIFLQVEGVPVVSDQTDPDQVDAVVSKMFVET